MSPDSLAVTMDSAITELKTLLGDELSLSTEWAAQATSRFETAAKTVLAREKPAVISAASRIRVMALCLAAEALRLGGADLSEKFKQIAAGITWLEARYVGSDLPVEVIVLALS